MGIRTGVQVVLDQASMIDKKKYMIHSLIVAFFAVLGYLIAYASTLPQTPTIGFFVLVGNLAVRYYEDVYQQQTQNQ